jgi:hypothetical protein
MNAKGKVDTPQEVDKSCKHSDFEQKSCDEATPRF